jgi:hypothetical protein
MSVGHASIGVGRAFRRDSFNGKEKDQRKGSRSRHSVRNG